MINNNKILKRIFDIIIAGCAIIILSPILLLTGLIIRIKIGKNIFFKQLRPGLNGKAFTIYKFRTMNDKCDENGQLLPDSERLTKPGIFLRSTSIDELPELFNVIKGEMSIVGPGHY